MFENIVSCKQFSHQATYTRKFVLAIPLNEFKPVIEYLILNAKGEFSILDWYGKCFDSNMYWRVYISNEQDAMAVRLLVQEYIEIEPI